MAKPVREPTLTHETEPLSREEELLEMLPELRKCLSRKAGLLSGGEQQMLAVGRALVTGHLELSEDGKAMKYLELAPFELRLTAEVITEALQASHQDAQETDEQQDGPMKVSDT